MAIKRRRERWQGDLDIKIRLLLGNKWYSRVPYKCVGGLTSTAADVPSHW